MNSFSKPCTKPFACFSCKNNFTGKAIKGPSQNFPYILHCGHSICVSCIRNNVKWKNGIFCPYCQKSTTISNKDNMLDKLSPDLYALGVHANFSTKISANFIQRLVKPKEVYSKAVSSTIRSVCSVCSEIADWRCNNCIGNFCNSCYIKIHKIENSVQSTHDVKPIFVAEETKCRTHKNETVKYFCEEDNELICGDCFSGKHNGHNDITIIEKNKSLKENIKEAVDEAVNIKKQLQLTEKKLASTELNNKFDLPRMRKKLEEYFHWLHSLLQMKEASYMDQLNQKVTESDLGLQNMRNQVGSDILQVTSLIMDGNIFLRDPCSPMNGVSLIKRLKRTNEMQCYLIPTNHGNDIIDICLNKSIQKSFDNFVEIKSNITPKFVLAASQEIPREFQNKMPEDTNSTDFESCNSISDEIPIARVCPLKGPSSLKDVIMKKKNVDVDIVCVSHIKSPSSFYVQRVSETFEFQILSSAMDKFGNDKANEVFIPKTLSIGDKYLAKYHQDGHWYRAGVKGIAQSNSPGMKIKDGFSIDSENDIEEVETAEDYSACVKGTKVITQTQVEIIFIDFGNRELVTVLNMRVIQPQFLGMPVQASECCLWEIVPKGMLWSKDSLKHFAKLIANKHITMIIMGELRGVLQVDLIQPSAIENDTPFSIREALVFMDLAHFTPNSLPGLPVSKRQQYCSLDGFVTSTKTVVAISHIETPSRFFIQTMNSRKYLEKLHSDIQKTYNEAESINLSINSPKIGHPYVAFFENINQWNRVTVESLPGDAKVNVKSVDYGYSSIVDSDCLRKISDRFLRLPIQAVQCCLADVVPIENEWGQETLKWFKSKTSKKFEMISHKKSPSQGDIVSLYDIESEFANSLNMEMVQEQLAKSVGAVQEEQAQVSTINYKNPPKTVEIKKNVPLNPVRVSYFESPSHFYIQLVTNDTDDLKKFTKDLEDCYSKSSSVNHNWEKGSLCAVTSKTLLKWCRGNVIEVSSSNKIEVFLYDHGIRETVSPDDMRTLHTKFTQQNDFAYKCHVEGIYPAGDTKKWAAQACERVQNLVDDKVVYLGKKQTELVDGSLAVDLLTAEFVRGGALEGNTTKYHSVYDMLISEGLAIPNRRMQKPAQPILENVPPVLKLSVLTPTLKDDWIPQTSFDWNIESVFPTYVGYDGCIYFHINNGMHEKLAEMRDALSKEFDSKCYRPPKEVIREGQICIAKYCYDGLWYRAKVIRVQHRKVEVFFVDYGNLLIMDLDDIRTQVTFLDVPIQCYECELHNIRPISEDGQWPIETLTFINYSIVDKLCIAFNDKESFLGKRQQVTFTLPGAIPLMDLLISKGMAKRIRASSEDSLLFMLPDGTPKYKEVQLPDINVRFPVSVTHFDENGHIFFQRLKVEPPENEKDLLLNYEHDRFIKIMDDFNKYASFWPSVENPVPGKTYCVQFSFDKCWYRGLVSEIKHSWASVIYIDYGNPENVPLSSGRIRKLPQCYMDYPKQGLLSKLHGVVPKSGTWDLELKNEIIALFGKCENSLTFAEVKAHLDSDQFVPEIDLFVLNIYEDEDKNKENHYSLAVKSLIDSKILMRIV